MTITNKDIKIFCIGANKTGTTSLMDFLIKYTNLEIAHQRNQELYFQNNNFKILLLF